MNIYSMLGNIIFCFSFICLILLYIYISFLNITVSSVDLLMHNKKSIFLRISIYISIVMFIIFTFVWRILNVSKIVLIPWDFFKVKQYFLDFIINYEISKICMAFIIIFCFLIFVLFFCLFLQIILYLKAEAYCAHMYLLQYRWYQQLLYNLFQKIPVKFITMSDSFIVNNSSSPSVLRKVIFFLLLHKSKILTFFINRIILWLPLYLFIYDFYLYSCINKFYFILPWVYFLVICRMGNKLVKSIYLNTKNNPRDLSIMENLYNEKRYAIFHVYRKNLTIYRKKIFLKLSNSKNKKT